MDEPTGHSRLVKCPRSAVILQMNNQRTSGSRCRQHGSDTIDHIYRTRNCRLAIEQTLLRVDHEECCRRAPSLIFRAEALRPAHLKPCPILP
jgi:hypothetical protein